MKKANEVRREKLKQEIIAHARDSNIRDTSSAIGEDIGYYEDRRQTLRNHMRELEEEEEWFNVKDIGRTLHVEATGCPNSEQDSMRDIAEEVFDILHEKEKKLDGVFGSAYIHSWEVAVGGILLWAPSLYFAGQIGISPPGNFDEGYLTQSIILSVMYIGLYRVLNDVSVRDRGI